MYVQSTNNLAAINYNNKPLMEEGFLQEWNVKFGPGVKPPECVFSLGPKSYQQPENVGRAIVECVSRVDKLKQELDKELFLLTWLRKLKDSSEGVDYLASAYQQSHVREEDFFVDKKGAKDSHRAGERPHLVLTVRAEASQEYPNFDTGLGRPPTSRSEDSPNSSEYYTAGPNSCSDTTSLSNLTEEESSPVSTRKRFFHNITLKDIQIAKLVRQKVIEEGRHWSCLNLNQVTVKGKELIRKPSPTGRHKRFHSAPSLEFERLPHQKSSKKKKKKKKRIWSTPCGPAVRDVIVVTSGLIEQAVFSPSPDTINPTSTIEEQNWPPLDRDNSSTHNFNTNSSGSVHSTQSSAEVSYTGRVVLRDKSKLSKSLSMDRERELGQWKGSGGMSSIAGKRSSNGILDSLDSYNFIVSHGEGGEDDDPALINVMASRVRGTLRTPRTSVNQPPLSPDSTTLDADQLTSPNQESQHIPASGSELGATVPPLLPLSGEEGSSRYIPPSLYRKNADSSPVKRDRFSYHYSDDECMTPKIDMGDPMAFSANSPLGSRGCSHRNSRSSNGILDEESTLVYDLTLKKINLESTSGDYGNGRKSNITSANVRGDGDEKRRSTENGGSAVYRRDREDDDEESPLTMTLTAHSHSRRDDPSPDVFESSPISGLSALGRLDMDIESTLSKLRDKPEMSMAGLLDARENQQMNAACRFDPTPEDLEYGESIEIDEATISVFTLNNNLYDSANSLPGLFSDTSGASSSSPPEQESPTHSTFSPSMVAAASAALQGVNLRQSGAGRRMNKKRMGADWGRDGLGGSDTDEKSPSMSSTSLTSEEESSVPTSPQGEVLVSFKVL